LLDQTTQRFPDGEAASFELVAQFAFGRQPHVDGILARLHTLGQRIEYLGVAGHVHRHVTQPLPSDVTFAAHLKA